MSQAGRDAGSESGENCDNFALFAPRGRASTIAGGNMVREQHSSHPNLPGIGNESDSEHAITYCIVINMLRDGARKQKKKGLHCWRFFYRAKKKKARKINKVSLLEQRVCPPRIVHF